MPVNINDKDALNALVDRIVTFCGKEDASLKQLGLSSATTDEHLRSEITRRIHQVSKVPGYAGLNRVEWLLAIAAPPQQATVTAREVHSTTKGAPLVLQQGEVYPTRIGPQPQPPPRPV
ncbi:hypothetical protein BD779DRAFT_1788616 [Infundibulicybe gibba]|nr:hypothetical protein BD779DRAFT_1788616 [Infundibulicybe gibba]